MSEEYVTKGGRVLTDADVQALADEAEAGYDPALMRPAPPRDPELTPARCPECTAGIFCTDNCAREPECVVCRHPKRLIGRAYPLESGPLMCDDDCPGYRTTPWPGHLWPQEWAEHKAGHPREDDDG